MRGIVRYVWAFRRTGLVELARRIGLVGLINPKLERALELGAGRPGALLTSRLRGRKPAPASVGPWAGDQTPAADAAPAAGAAGDRRVVGYWISCGYNYVLPEVGESTVRVLERMGYAVEVLDNCCCGMAAYGYGDREAATGLAKENLRRLGDLERFDAIVSECGSCSGHLKDYPHLLAGEPEWAERAESLRAKMRSFSEFVVQRGGLTPLLAVRDGAVAGGASAADGAAASRATPAEQVVTYHDPCHLGARYQNVVAQPRQLLQSVPGVAFKEADEADSCCGAAGTYAMLHPETSAAIIKRKMEFIGATGASVVATECPSCMMQLRYGARASGLALSVLNVSQICDRATAAASDSE
jgi:glycolate oxidase iron-sulfur subunit